MKKQNNIPEHIQKNKQTKNSITASFLIFVSFQFKSFPFVLFVSSGFSFNFAHKNMCFGWKLMIWDNCTIPQLQLAFKKRKL